MKVRYKDNGKEASSFRFNPRSVDEVLHDKFHPSLTLERIDNNKGYSKENCRWATCADQNRNKRNNVIIEHQGIKMCLSDWAKKIGRDRNTLKSRLKKSGSVEKALSNENYK